MTDINICYAPNENYAGLAAVSMVSVLKNASPDDNINFIILYNKDNFSDFTVQKLKQVSEIRPCNIRFINMSLDEFKDFPLTNWVTIETWYRTKVTELCPEYNKILYLDCDTIVTASLNDLFNTDLGDNYVGIVGDKGENRLNLQDNIYFNAGVILFNTEFCNKNHLFNQIKTFIKNNKKYLKFADQDVLNIITDEKKYKLPEEYNYCENYFKVLDYEILDNPKIIHFIGPNPNRFDCMHSKKHIWEEYSKLTPFYNDFIEKNIYNMIKMYPKLQFDRIKYKILSKISFGKQKNHYKTKSIILERIFNKLHF